MTAKKPATKNRRKPPAVQTRALVVRVLNENSALREEMAELRQHLVTITSRTMTLTTHTLNLSKQFERVLREKETLLDGVLGNTEIPLRLIPPNETGG